MKCYSEKMEIEYRTAKLREARIARFKRLKADPERYAAVKAHANQSKQVFDAATRIMRGQATAEDLRNPDVADLVVDVAK